MKSLLTAIAFLATTNLFAHVLPGSYQGKDQTGADCSFTVHEDWFEDNMPHPLTERLPVSAIKLANVTTSEVIWNLGHPPVVNIESGLNRFNHDIFQQIVPNSTGATSVTLIKSEEKEEAQKPIGIIYIEDNYKNKNESKKVTCLL